VGMLTWLAAVAALVGAALMSANLRAFELVLEPDIVRRLANGMLTLIMSSALFVFVALLRTHLGPPGRSLCGALLAVVWLASVAAPLVLRGRGTALGLESRSIDAAPGLDPADRQARVSVIAIDGG